MDYYLLLVQRLEVFHMEATEACFIDFCGGFRTFLCLAGVLKQFVELLAAVDIWVNVELADS